jgi:hypothetical protein
LNSYGGHHERVDRAMIWKVAGGSERVDKGGPIAVNSRIP